MKNFLVTNPFDSSTIMLFGTKAEASTWAIRANRRALVEHPAYNLYEVLGNKATYIGTLFREFGVDFDPSNCWALYNGAVPRSTNT